MRHILGNSEKLLRMKPLKFLIKVLRTLFELYISIQNNKFVKRKNEVIKRRNVK